MHTPRYVKKGCGDYKKSSFILDVTVVMVRIDQRLACIKTANGHYFDKVGHIVKCFRSKLVPAFPIQRVDVKKL